MPTPPTDTTTREPALVSDRTLSLLDKGAEIEAAHPAHTGDLGFTHPLMTLISLPMRDPGDTPLWEARNGSVVFTLRPAIVRGPDGQIIDSGYTYGMTPRRVMLYLMSEAVRTQSPRIHLGSSLRSFLRSVGATAGGKNAQLVTEQVRRLLASPITLEDFRRDDQGRQQISGANLSMAESYRFTFTDSDTSGIGISDDDGNVLDSWITLADPFYRALMESPAPVDLRAIAAMGSSPLKFDLMAWAAYRLPTLTSPLHVSWDDLFHQFGLSDAAPRQARSRFRAALKDMQAVYGAARIEELPTGLKLWPSKPLVPRAVPKKGASRSALQALAAVEATSPEPPEGDELSGPALVRKAVEESREKVKKKSGR